MGVTLVPAPQALANGSRVNFAQKGTYSAKSTVHYLCQMLCVLWKLSELPCKLGSNWHNSLQKVLDDSTTCELKLIPEWSRLVMDTTPKTHAPLGSTRSCMGNCQAACLEVSWAISDCNHNPFIHLEVHHLQEVNTILQWHI
mmetsp:Transcript_2317/g.6552  ORF Transcript_2317/g.6552 Transcript_2317/m.6552 type:complete len:142 (+) Transcript_2317:2935-3360(+)